VIQTSSNQPVLPHTVIVFNASENNEREGFWDTETNTREILKDLSSILDKNETFHELAQLWRGREKSIKSLDDLFSCYYSSVKVRLGLKSLRGL